MVSLVAAFIHVSAFIPISNEPFFAETVITAKIIDTLRFFVTGAGACTTFITVVTVIPISLETWFAFATKSAGKVFTFCIR